MCASSRPTWPWMRNILIQVTQQFVAACRRSAEGGGHGAMTRFAHGRTQTI